jgi:hypothetical protein
MKARLKINDCKKETFLTRFFSQQLDFFSGEITVISPDPTITPLEQQAIHQTSCSFLV